MSAVTPTAQRPQPGTAVDVELPFIICPVTCGCSSAPGSSRGLAVVCWPERKSNIGKKHTSLCQAFVKTSDLPPLAILFAEELHCLASRPPLRKIRMWFDRGLPCLSCARIQF